MGATIVLLSVCITLLIMVSILFALWDVLTGRWSKANEKHNLQEDTDSFEDNQ